MTVPGFEAGAPSGPLEFRLQIVVEVSEASGGPTPHGGAPAEAAPDPSRLSRLMDSAQSLLAELSQGLDVRMASFTSPSGVRLVAQGVATPENLAGIRAVAAALARRPPHPR